MNILIIIGLLLITIALVKGYECFYRALRYVRLRKIRSKDWNSFTGYRSEQDQISETLDRR
jgi:hypothetical protein